MVSLAVENLEKKPDTLRHIRHLLVDEYQDINRAQEKLIQLIGRNAGIFIVGDPRQTIYKWRGSDETCFEDFAEIYPGAETIYLTEKRRSGRVAYLDDGSLREVGVSERHLADAREAVERHISGVLSKDFRPQSGQHCRSCDYGPICRWRGCQL